MKRKGQLSVEFFILLAVVAAFILILYSNGVSQREQTRLLSAAVQSKAGVDGLANAANYVFLSGEGSVMRKEFFVANGSLCLYVSETGDYLYCTVPGAPTKTGSVRVRSIPLYSTPTLNLNNDPLANQLCAPNPSDPNAQGKLLVNGWYLFNASFSSGVVTIACEKKLG